MVNRKTKGLFYAEDADVEESLFHCFIATLLKTFKPEKTGKTGKPLTGI